MKPRFILLTLMFLSVSLVSAQSNEVLNAWNYMKNDQLDKAKVSIDKAVQHPKTKETAKAWYYRGLLYQKIFLSKKEAYKNLCPNPLVVAEESFLNAFKYDYKKLSPKEMAYNTQICGKQLINRGINYYNEKQYQQSLDALEAALKIKDHFKEVDTITYYSAGLAAMNAGNKEKAAKYFQKCIDNNYKTDGHLVYYHYASLYKDSDKERYKTLITEGRKKYPDDGALLTEEINLLLAEGNNDEAMSRLNKAIEHDPRNKTLYQARGAILQNKGDETGAENDYKKAIELDPEYFDAQYNLGALYYNQAVEDLKKVNDIPPSKMKEYEVAKAANDKLFLKALPNLEKAHQIDAGDMMTMKSLKEIYARSKMTDKYEAIKKEMEN